MNQISCDFYDQKAKPMVNSVNNECCFVRPHTTCVNSCGAQEEPGSWKVGPRPLFCEANPDFRQVGVQGPKPDREKAEAGNSPAGLTRGSSFCSPSGLSVNTSAVRLGSRFRASEVHQANPLFIQKVILGLLSLGSVGVVFSGFYFCFWPCHEACRALVP